MNKKISLCNFVILCESLRYSCSALRFIASGGEAAKWLKEVT